MTLKDGIKTENRIQNPNISVDCVLFGFDGDNLKVLLIRQKSVGNENEAKLALPGDLVFDNEDLDKAAVRVLEELTSLDNISMYQFHTFGNVNRVKEVKDQEWLRTFRAKPEARVITVGYYSLVNLNEYQPKPASFADKTIWHDAFDLPHLAFDHNEIFKKAFQTLKAEFSTKSRGFELLPEKFTLTQLQTLYEMILNKKLDKRNFRKKFKKEGKLIALDEKQEGVLHKPAQLYKYSK
ncbi:NUDIX hydrolase [Hyphobacterium sp. CCMP332]|nr:NUDIX hydrolase [Hyphobacterium sp. CCMP332]